MRRSHTPPDAPVAAITLDAMPCAMLPRCLPRRSYHAAATLPLPRFSFRYAYATPLPPLRQRRRDDIFPVTPPPRFLCHCYFMHSRCQALMPLRHVAAVFRQSPLIDAARYALLYATRTDAARLCHDLRCYAFQYARYGCSTFTI